MQAAGCNLTLTRFNHGGKKVHEWFPLYVSKVENTLYVYKKKVFVGSYLCTTAVTWTSTTCESGVSGRKGQKHVVRLEVQSVTDAGVHN